MKGAIARQAGVEVRSGGAATPGQELPVLEGLLSPSRHTYRIWKENDGDASIDHSALAIPSFVSFTFSSVIHFLFSCPERRYTQTLETSKSMSRFLASGERPEPWSAGNSSGMPTATTPAEPHSLWCDFDRVPLCMVVSSCLLLGARYRNIIFLLLCWPILYPESSRDLDWATHFLVILASYYFVSLILRLEGARQQGVFGQLWAV